MSEGLLSVLPRGSIIDIRARVWDVFLNGCRYSVVARIDSPDSLGFQQVCVPAERVYLRPGGAAEIEPPGNPDIDRLTAALLKP